MLPGYNHNVEYQDRTFHIQTEDSGIENPHIISHLFEGGNILETRKCDYANILANEQRDKVLMSLMLNQHQSIIRELESGKLDHLLLPPEAQGASEEVPENPGEPISEAEEKEQPEAAATPGDDVEDIAPTWLNGLPETRIIHRRSQTLESHARSQQELDELAQLTIKQIVDAGSGMPMPSSSASQDTLADALNVILSAVDEEPT